jgi:hypothetical protein
MSMGPRDVQDAGRRSLPQNARAGLRTLLAILNDLPPGSPVQSPEVTFHEISLRSALIFGSIWWAALWGLVGLIVAYSVLQTELDAERAALILVTYPIGGVVFFTPITTAIAALYDVVARRFGGFAAVLTELHTAETDRQELDVTVHRVRLQSAAIFGAIWWIALWAAIGFVVTIAEISGFNHNRFGMYAFFYLPVIYGLIVFTPVTVVLTAFYNLAANKWRGFVLGLTELEAVGTAGSGVRVTVHRVDLRSVLMFGSAFWFTVAFIIGMTATILDAVGAIELPLGMLTGAFILAGTIPLTLLSAALAVVYNGVAQSYGGFAVTLSVPPELLRGGLVHDLAHVHDIVQVPDRPRTPTAS